MQAAIHPSIAVVDDDPRILKLLELELIDEGFLPRCFSDPLTLLDHMAAERPDLVLLDLMMPSIDGIECLRRLRQAGYNCPVLIFTALSDNEKRMEAQAEGADAYILKPDLFQNLPRVIGKYLRP